jgi:hypothetical protein
MQVGADVLVYGKTEAAGPIDEPTFDKAYLGTETDLFVNYRIFSDLSMGVRYGVFFPGAAIAGNDDIRQFVLLSVTLSF